MNRKKVLQDIALRLKKIRETLGFSPVDMTKRIGTYRTNYYKYENATNFPHFAVLARLGNKLGVSLDWFWVGKLVDHPEIMTQGETVEEVEENMVDAYRMMVLEDVPVEYKTKEIVLAV